jgi:tetratricopeptide (TPR) repeat protein
LAAVSEARNDWTTSVELFARWNELGTFSANDYTRWARSLLLAGERQEALKKLQQAHALDASLNPAELALAALLTENNDFQEANNWYTIAEKKYPDDQRVYFEYAGALLLAGKSAAAEEKLDLLEAKVKQHSLRLDVALLRGLIARSQKQYDAAEVQFTTVLKTIPGHPTALQHLPLVLVEQASNSKRNRALQIALLHAQQQPQSATALSTLGWVQFRLGKPEAEDTLIAAASLPGRNAETLYFTAQALMAAGKAEQCGRYLEALRGHITKPQLFVLRSEAQEWLDTLVLAIPK